MRTKDEMNAMLKKVAAAWGGFPHLSLAQVLTQACEPYYINSMTDKDLARMLDHFTGFSDEDLKL